MQTTPQYPPEDRYKLVDLSIDLRKQTVFRAEEHIVLPNLSFKLLATLVRCAPDTITKDDLIKAVWGDVVVSDETLAQRVRLLRMELGEDAQNPRYISSVRGRGYRLIGELNPESHPAGDPAQPKSNNWRWGFLLACLLLLAGGWHYFQNDFTARANTNSLAILPFQDLSIDQSYRYFADGMQEELLSRLSRLENLSVLSRTSLENYRSSGLSLPKIAKELRANQIIEGSVRVENDLVRITVQLIDADSDLHLWAENFEATLSVQNIFAIQQEAAEKIAQALELRYGETNANNAILLPTESLEAYNAYLLGRHHTFKQTPDGLELGVAYLQQATEIDPEFAQAFASLGWAYAFLGEHYGGQAPRDVYPKAREAAIRAIALDNNLSDARSLYADILTWYDWDFKAAEKEYLNTVALESNNVLGYALFLSTQLRHEEALQKIEKRLLANPNEPYVHINAAWRYLNAGQLQRTRHEAKQAGKHADANTVLGLVALASGNSDEAINIFLQDLQERGRNPRQLSNLARAYFLSGQTTEAKPLLAELLAVKQKRYVSPELIAAVYFSANNPDKGFAYLQEALEEKARGIIFIQVNQMLKGYRDDPRYKALVREIGFNI